MVLLSPISPLIEARLLASRAISCALEAALRDLPAVTVRTSRKAMVATRWNRPKRCQARSTRQTWHSAPPSPRAPPLASCWTGCHKRPEEGRSVQKRAVGSRGHSRRRRAWHAGMAGLGGEERLSHGCQVHVGQRRDAGITHREGVAATLKFSELRAQGQKSVENNPPVPERSYLA